MSTNDSSSMPMDNSQRTPDTTIKSSDADQREQPWRRFVSVPQKQPLAFVAENRSIRMIDGRVDGKGLGG